MSTYTLLYPITFHNTNRVPLKCELDAFLVCKTSSTNYFRISTLRCVNTAKTYWRISTRAVRISWTILVKFCTEDLYIIPLDHSEFRKYRCSDSHTLLNGINKMFYFIKFSSDLKKKIRTVCPQKLTKWKANFVKLGVVTAILYLEG
jgi:hypothetical protein